MRIFCTVWFPRAANNDWYSQGTKNNACDIVMWPSDAIWWYKSGSTLARVMAWCRQAVPADGTKPLPESMWTYHQRCFVAFTWEIRSEDQINFFLTMSKWFANIFWYLCYFRFQLSSLKLELADKRQPVSYGAQVILTLNVRGPSYLGLTRSISWLLMPWLLTSPGHQQPWYWLCRICKS